MNPATRQDVHDDRREQLVTVAAALCPDQEPAILPEDGTGVPLRDGAVPHVLAVGEQEGAQADGEVIEQAVAAHQGHLVRPRGEGDRDCWALHGGSCDHFFPGHFPHTRGI